MNTSRVSRFKLYGWSGRIEGCTRTFSSVIFERNTPPFLRPNDMPEACTRSIRCSAYLAAFRAWLINAMDNLSAISQLQIWTRMDIVRVNLPRGRRRGAGDGFCKFDELHYFFRSPPFSPCLFYVDSGVSEIERLLFARNV